MAKQLELSKVHEYKKVRLKDGKYAVRMIRKRPLARFTSGQNPPLFAQDGDIFSEGRGKPPISREEYPGWLQEGIMKMSSEGRGNIGFPIGSLPCEEPASSTEGNSDDPTVEADLVVRVDEPIHKPSSRSSRSGKDA